MGCSRLLWRKFVWATMELGTHWYGAVCCFFLPYEARLSFNAYIMSLQSSCRFRYRTQLVKTPCKKAAWALHSSCKEFNEFGEMSNILFAGSVSAGSRMGSVRDPTTRKRLTTTILTRAVPARASWGTLPVAEISLAKKNNCLAVSIITLPLGWFDHKNRKIQKTIACELKIVRCPTSQGV